MAEREPARPAVRPSQDEIKSTRERLEREGLPSDAAYPPAHDDAEPRNDGPTMADVQPAAPVVKEPIKRTTKDA